MAGTAATAQFAVRRVAVGPHFVDVHGTFDAALPPVVLVHGIGVASGYFVPFAEQLAGAWNVLAVDLPGYGATPRPPRPLTVPELAEVLATVIGALGLEAPVVVGHSMGCQIVVRLVGAHPRRCRRYVLIGPTVDDAARTLVRQAWRLARDTLRESAAANAVIFRDYLRMGPIRYLRTARWMLEDRIEENIRACPVPGLVVRGERDPIAPRRWVQRLARLAPDARAVEVPGAPHAVQFTHPEELRETCLPFLGP